MSDHVLEVKALDASYGQSQILWGAALSVKKASITTIMGRNGVGKTTLLKSLMGLLPPSGGEVMYKGENVSRLSPHKKAKKGIGYVPQGREIIPKLTVYENLRIGLEANPDRKAKVPEDEIYELFPILKDFRKRMGGNLSGGQQQQLAIARALTGNPSLILLDEPTEGIQPSITDQIGEVLKKLVAEKGISVLLVEQKIDFAKQVTDFYYFMDRGRMVSESSAENITQDELQKHLSV